MTIEFDGTDFFGWQKQPGVRTVQGVLEGALGDLLRRPVVINGCCRTDAGVHAWALVCNFVADTTLSSDEIRRALNAKLPDDVVVRHADDAARIDFHARHDCVARRYVYRLATAPTAVNRRVLAQTKYEVDVEKMARAATAIVGTYDFRSFTPTSIGKSIPTDCNVMTASVTREGSVVSFEIKADRFLQHMVRSIVGTLIDVGRGRIGPEQFAEILCKKDRRAAGPTAPPCGLALAEVYYSE